VKLAAADWLVALLVEARGKRPPRDQRRPTPTNVASKNRGTQMSELAPPVKKPGGTRTLQRCCWYLSVRSGLLLAATLYALIDTATVVRDAPGPCARSARGVSQGRPCDLTAASALWLAPQLTSALESPHRVARVVPATIFFVNNGWRVTPAAWAVQMACCSSSAPCSL
jgi:hypothetical protein